MGSSSLAGRLFSNFEFCLIMVSWIFLLRKSSSIFLCSSRFFSLDLRDLSISCWILEASYWAFFKVSAASFLIYSASAIADLRTSYASCMALALASSASAWVFFLWTSASASFFLKDSLSVFCLTSASFNSLSVSSFSRRVCFSASSLLYSASFLSCSAFSWAFLNANSAAFCWFCWTSIAFFSASALLSASSLSFFSCSYFCLAAVLSFSFCTSFSSLSCSKLYSSSLLFSQELIWSAKPWTLSSRPVLKG